AQEHTLKKTQKRNKKLAHNDHNPNPSQALATASKALTKPATQGTARLKAHPTPRQLCRHPAHMPVAGLGNALFPGTLAALIRRRRKARQGPHFPTILEGAPAEKFHHQ